MPWSKPDFVEITLCMEVTAYVNTDDEKVTSDRWSVISERDVGLSSFTTDHRSPITDH